MFAFINNNCLHLYKKLQQEKMKEKTPENRKKAGRPFGVPTSVISVRIPTDLKKKADERFGNHWAGMFRHFVEVYLLEKDPIEIKKK